MMLPVGRRLDAIADWLNGVEHARDDVPPSDPSTATTAPSRDPAARAVNGRQALGLSAVYRAVEIRAVSAKQVSVDALDSKGDVLETQPLLLRKPEISCSRGQTVEKIVVSLDLTGNAYWRNTRDAKKRVTNIEILNPNDVKIRVTDLGRVIGYTYRGKDCGLDEISHLSRLRVPGTPYGLGPIQAAQLELRGALDTTQYGADFINSGDVPTGILKTDAVLTEDTAKQARDQWDSTRGGRRGVAVLGQGLDYRQTFISPKDAQFIESQNWNATTVTRLFGVPASLMLIAVESSSGGSADTYQNVEQDWLGFVRFGLMNDLIEIEDAFTQILPRGQRAKFNIEALLRADTKSRMDIHKIAIDMGLYSAEYARGIEGIPESAAPETPDAAPAAPEAPAPEGTES